MEQQASEHDRNLVGAQLDGRYRVGPVLAHGGMSTVYRGTDTRLDREVAIKVMSPRFTHDPVFLQRFEREARATARLQHPGIVGVHDQGVDSSPAGDRVFLVMELVDGGTLRDLLRQRGSLSVPLAISVAETVLSALAAAHEKGLIHRDIKPENVLIGSGGVVKVADFGLVRAVAEASSATGDVILGTVAYLSPEQVETGAADARSDVYATGVLLFEMLTGTPPYAAETALSVAYRHVNEDMPAPSAVGAAVPAALDELIVRATRRDPGNRPQHAAEFLQALREVRAGLGIGQVRVPVPELSARSVDAPNVPPPEMGPRGTRALTRVHAGPRPRPESVPLDDPYQRERARNRRAFIVWMVVVLVLAGAVGVSAWWLGSGQWTVVPNLLGLQRGVVPAALTAADLHFTLVEDHNDTVPGDRVIRTDPAPGQEMTRGSAVTVVISLGHPVVPQIEAGGSAEDAEKAIEQADLDPLRDPNAAVFDRVVPSGAVIGLRPVPGTVLTVGAPVTIVISKGPAPVIIPDVRGMRQADAIAALNRAGLTPQVQRQFDDKIAGGHAIGTEPRAGSGLVRGARVTLLVSNAPVVPDVRGMTVAQARQTLTDAGLNSTVTGTGSFDGFGFLDGFTNRVVSQSPDPGRPVRPGTTVTLTTF